MIEEKHCVVNRLNDKDDCGVVRLDCFLVGDSFVREETRVEKIMTPNGEDRDKDDTEHEMIDVSYGGMAFYVESWYVFTC